MNKHVRYAGSQPIRNQRGTTAVIVALCMVVFLGMGALAVDLGHLYVVRNELHNAADAGALAGARFLYNDTGSVNEGANQIAYDAATANRSDRVPVDVNWVSGNTGDVQRGHWSFSTKIFTPNDSTALVQLWDRSDEDLDGDPNFINAVRVVARRQATQAASFFARIFGYEGFEASSEAVAYIGFAGSFDTGEADQPLAICAQSLRTTGEDVEKFTCSIGRMLNSGTDTATHNTGGWTNFSQPCETANASEMASLICGGGNPNPFGCELDQEECSIGTTGGVQDSTFTDLRNCWMQEADSDGDLIPDQPWELYLPVVECPGNNVSNCSELAGAVKLSVIWMTGSGTPKFSDPPPDGPPTSMGNWSSNDPDGQVRWDSFVDHFFLKNADGEDAPFSKKSIYFLPVCDYDRQRIGLSGGKNFGILADIPVLVK